MTEIDRLGMDHPFRSLQQLSELQKEVADVTALSAQAAESPGTVKSPDAVSESPDAAAEPSAAESSKDGARQNLSLGGFLTSVAHWQQMCQRHGLARQAERCEQLSREAFSEAARDWRQTVETRRADRDPDTLFDDLLGTCQLEADIRNRELLDCSSLQPLRDLRESLKESLLETLSTDGSSADEQDSRESEGETSERTATDRETIRRHASDQQAPFSEASFETWSRLLTDQCDTILTTVDDLSPEDAAEQIDSTIDLVHWYLRNIAPKRSRVTRRLQRKLRRLRAEQQERRLQASMETRFGSRFTARLERCVLLLICVVLVLMTIEWTMTLSPQTVFWFAVIDAAACVVFLTEFFLKLWLVRGRIRWFFRHLLIDFIPSIPIGLLTAGLADTGDLVRAGRAARFARLPRFIRYVRVLRPAMRIARALGLMARGIDRLARRYGHVLNVNVILHPTRTEQDIFEREQRRERRDLDELRQMLRDSWARLLVDAPESQRTAIADARINGLAETLEQSRVLFEDSRGSWTGARDIPAEALLDRMEFLEPALVVPALGEPMAAHLARIIRIMAVAPLRWFPLIRSCIPSQARQMTDAQVVSETSRKTARFLRKFHDAWFWVTDLYGTVTPSQFVDRVGGLLVKSSFRPAYRLAVFGGFLLLTEAVLHIVSLEALEPVRQFLKRFVGTTVLVLGGLCFVVLALGWWLQRVAREATEFYEKSVQAQFLHLMDSIRPRQLERDARVLYERVLAADWPGDDGRDDAERAAALARCLNGSLSRSETPDEFLRRMPFIERLQLLYHDWLDGAMFTTSDTRTTNQLLGNTALSQLMLMSERFSKKEMRSLFQVDLENQKSGIKGPYLWFQFISQSVSHSVARLMVDYNRRAVPVHELQYFPHRQALEFAEWLDVEAEAREGIAPPPSADMPAARRARMAVEDGYLTTSFTALHFLDTDPARDRMIEEQFGPEVAERLRQDRSLLIRRTFGTLPLHLKPRSERVVNLYAFYEGWLAGGRIFFVPWFLFLAGCRGFGRLVVWIYRSVQEIRHPERRRDPSDAAQADFRVAVRKIGRVRSPVAEKCVRLRAMFDPAWLGVPLPGEDSAGLAGNAIGLSSIAEPADAAAAHDRRSDKGADDGEAAGDASAGGADAGGAGVDGRRTDAGPGEAGEDRSDESGPADEARDEHGPDEPRSDEHGLAEHGAGEARPEDASRASTTDAVAGRPAPRQLSTSDDEAALADIRFLRLGPAVEQKIESEQRRCRSGMRWLEHALNEGLLQSCAERRGLKPDAFSTWQHLRAAGVAVHADLLGVRTHLFSRSILDEVLQTTDQKPSRLDFAFFRRKLNAAFCRYCNLIGLSDEQARRAAWKAVIRNERGCRAALLAWDAHGDDVQAEGERRLSDLLLHPGRITEQLLTLRTVQTMTVLDVLHYREHVFRLGQYDDGAEFIELPQAAE